MIANPFRNYSDQCIVDDPKMVFGRDSEITEIIDSLCDDRGRLRKGRSIALWGQKRSGKSTLLYHVRRRIIERFSKDVIIIDLGSVGSYDYRGGSFRRNLMLGIISKLLLPIRRRSEEFREICGAIPSIEEMTGTSYDHVFNNFMERFTEAQEALCPESRLVIFLDEFTYLYTYIRNGNVDETFFEFWKAFSERFGCISIIVGRDNMPRFQALPMCANAFGTTFFYRVGYLSRDAVEDFIRSPLRGERCEIHDDAVSRLYELTAGNAYLLMVLCDCMVNYINKHKLFTVSEHIINSIADDAIETGRICIMHFHPLFNDSVHERDEKYLKLLKVLAEHQMCSSYVSYDIIRKDLSVWSDTELEDILLVLVEQDVLTMIDREYSIKVVLFAVWLHKHKKEFRPLRNPYEEFSKTSPVKNNKMFFGRDAEIESIIRALCTEDGTLICGRSIALWGQKRVGKSSLLFHLREEIKRRFSDASFIIDMGSIGNIPPGPNFTREFMIALLSAIRRNVRHDLELCPRIYDDIRNTINKMMSGDGYTTIFSDAMENFADVLCDRQIMLFVDEFTYLFRNISNGTVDAHFFDFWKYMIERFGIISILVGQDSMPKLKTMSACANALASVQLWPIYYLSPEAVTQMVREPFKEIGASVDDGAIELLRSLTAGSPYLMMILCDGIIKHLNARKTTHLSRNLAREIAHDLLDAGVINKSQFNPLYNDSMSTGDAEQNSNADDSEHDRRNLDLMYEVAMIESERQGPAPFADIAERMMRANWREGETRSALSDLTERKVLTMYRREYSIIVGIFKDWLCEHY